MKSENNLKRETNLQNVKILDFDENYIEDILRIQAECDLSVWSKNDYLGELERADSIFKIAQSADGKIAGFALARLLIGENRQNDPAITFNSSEILNIAVRKNLQSKKIGQMIFNEILRELRQRNVLEIWLEVRKSNAKAISFYQKNGFEMRFERKNYYTNPTENACVFQRLIYAVGEKII